MDVRIQGTEVLHGFDVRSETGARNKAIVKEFRGVRIDEVLKIELSPSAGASVKRTVLCAVEVIHE